MVGCLDLFLKAHVGLMACDVAFMSWVVSMKYVLNVNRICQGGGMVSIGLLQHDAGGTPLS